MAAAIPPDATEFATTVPERARGLAEPSSRTSEMQSKGFERLWRAFMWARVLVALAVVALHLTMHSMGHPMPRTLLTLCMAYLALTLLVRIVARPRGPGRAFDAQWLYTVGADMAFFVVLQVQQATGLNYTPLLALPVLMASIMGSRALALGTAALATLALLGYALWRTDTEAWYGTTDVAQAAFTGAGLLVLALITHQLAARLAREESAAARSRAETQIQAMVNDMVIEALSDGVLVVGADLLVRVANPAARRMLGSDQEVTPIRFGLDDNPAWVQLARIAELTFRDEDVDGVEVTLHHEDRHGSHLLVRTQRTPVTATGGGLCVMFLQDLREMEAQLRTEKLAAMGRMSAAVAHEIRNPLAAISQANALLQEDLTSAAHQRLITMVQQNAERLGHIVDDVLDVARVQGQGSANGAQAIELDELVTGFAQEWAVQLGAGDRLLLNAEAPEAHVQFAHEHLRRILVNLLDNAARYASRGAGAIQVSTRSVRHGPAMLMVWSDGPPLEPSVRRHLFEPFFSSESRSSGLGLFICRELCERHGATIGYERTEREQNAVAVQGNEFFVSFRRAHGPNSILDQDHLDFT